MTTGINDNKIIIERADTVRYRTDINQHYDTKCTLSGGGLRLSQESPSRGDLASLCLKARWLPVSLVLSKLQLKEVSSLVQEADIVPCLWDKILLVAATRRRTIPISEKITVQIRQSTAEKTSASVQSLISPAFSSLPLC